jgi:hypothetical protein
MAIASGPTTIRTLALRRLPKRTVNHKLVRSERGLCARNRILGGGVGRGAKPPPNQSPRYARRTCSLPSRS